MPARFLMLILIAQSCYAKDHLEPEESQFTREILPGYTQAVLEYFDSAYDEDVVLRLITLPSFSPEYVLGIKKQDGEFSIFYESPKTQIWGYDPTPVTAEEPVDSALDDSDNTDTETFVELNEEPIVNNVETNPENIESQDSESFLNIPRNSCSVYIDDGLAADISHIWQEMLFETRYTKTTSGDLEVLDGVAYHFSASTPGHKLIGGQTESPKPDTKPGKLVKLADLMSDYCHDAEPETLDALSLHTTAFREELENSERSIEVDETSDIDS